MLNKYIAIKIPQEILRRGNITDHVVKTRQP